MQTRSMIHVTHLPFDRRCFFFFPFSFQRYEYGYDQIRFYFWKFYSIASLPLRSTILHQEVEQIRRIILSFASPVILFFSWQEGATIYIDPWLSISLPSIRSRKMNSPLSSGEIWFQRRKRAHTHSCREKEGSSETLSLLLEEPANEPQGFAQRLPG